MIGLFLGLSIAFVVVFGVITESTDDDIAFFQQMHEELSLDPVESTDDKEITATWFGTAFMHFTDGHSGILVDPFVSYQPLTTVVGGGKLIVDPEAVSQTWAKLNGAPVNGIFITHSHYDHIIDAAAFAKLCDCTVYGSESTAFILRSHGYEDVQVVADFATVKIGSFRVSFLPGQHGKSFVESLSFPGVVTEAFEVPATAHEYKMGRVFALHFEHPDLDFVHQASAGFVEGMYKGKKADVVFLGIALRPQTDQYLMLIDELLEPQMVVPIHYDDFIFRYKKFRVMPTVQFQEFVTTGQEMLGRKKIRFLNRDVASAIAPN